MPLSLYNILSFLTDFSTLCLMSTLLSQPSFHLCLQLAGNIILHLPHKHLLFGASNTLTFKVIINRYVFIAILKLMFCSSLFFPSWVASLVIWSFFFFSVILVFFLSNSNVGFWYVVTMGEYVYSFKFKHWKGVHQGCILSPCLFNFYAGYIMRNAGLEETQAGIKIARRNINNLRYADNTTLW